MSAAHIEAGTEVTVTVTMGHAVMQCCCGLGGPATVAVVAVDVVAVQRCRLQGGDQCAHQHGSALLCTEILLHPGSAARSKYHAARASPRTRRYPDTRHVAAGQHNTTLHVATCEHGGAATCRLLLRGVAPEVLRALVLAGAALPVGRAGGVRHGGGS